MRLQTLWIVNACRYLHLLFMVFSGGKNTYPYYFRMCRNKLFYCKYKESWRHAFLFY